MEWRTGVPECPPAWWVKIRNLDKVFLVVFPPGLAYDTENPDPTPLYPYADVACLELAKLNPQERS